ncbi:MAG: hypothetical protein AAB197_04825 [Deltaproteobacteria bacterium]
MIDKRVLVILLFFLSASFSFEARADHFIWGPKKYLMETEAPVTITEKFTIERPASKFWLFIENGGIVHKPGELNGAIEPVDRVSSISVKLNGVQIVEPNNLNQHVANVIRRDLALYANNTIEVEVRGRPGSYITVSISSGEPNPKVSNKHVDLTGTNMRNRIYLVWDYEKKAHEYIIYHAYSIDGPWTIIGGSPSLSAIDGTFEAQTRDLCYKIEAWDANGKVLRVYEPICVPKWRD